MKTLSFIFSVILIWNISLKAQPDSNYYPLQIGNYWEYWGTDYGKWVKWYTVIRGDTLMRNGKTYFISYNNFQSGSSNFEYQEYLRSENNSIVYKYTSDYDTCTDHEQILYDFSVKDSSYWPMCLGWGSQYEKYHYGIYHTFSDYYLNFGYLAETKFFTNVVIRNENGTEKIIWNPIKGIGTVKIAKGIGQVSSLAELSPLWELTGAIINGKKYGKITIVDKSHSIQLIPKDFSIAAYPNPFNNSCKLNLNIPEEGNLTISVYNMLGQKVRLIHNGEVQKGNYSFDFTSSGLSSGAYTVAAQINSKLTTIKTFLFK